MDEYERWVYEVVDVTLRVQAYWRRNEGELRARYGDLSPDSPVAVRSPREITDHLDSALEISRGVTLSREDRNALLHVSYPMTERLQQFDEQHREFNLGLSPWHIIRKDDHIRIIDLTFPPIGTALKQFENMTWHLESRRDVTRSYLYGREKLGLPPFDRDEFLLLTDWLNVLLCVQWIGLYGRDILKGEHFLAGLDGERLNDYTGSETANLEAIYRTVAPHGDLAFVADLLKEYFSKPLSGGTRS